MHPVLGHRAVANPEVLTRHVGDELVLMSMTSDAYFGLDPVGREIWSAVTTGPTVGAAVDELLTVFAVERAELEADVVDLVEHLVREGLLFTEPVVPNP